MAVRYTPDELKFLRDSPLVQKPPGLPPIEQWMGPPAETGRTTTTRTTDRSKNQDTNTLLEQASRRPQHITRNSTNAENIVLGPVQTVFSSATSNRNPLKTFGSTDRPPLRDADSPRDRFSFRGKNGEGEDDRVREGGRNNLLRPKRAEGDQDSDGWSTVKPRKSFGTEGAERFNGRMGGVDRSRDEKKDEPRREDRRREDGREERKFRDRDDRETKERPQRGFDSYTRDKDGDHDHPRDTHKNGGTGRGGRGGDSWLIRDRDNDAPTPSTRDRTSNGDKFMDRSRGWREKDPEDRGGDRAHERRGDRNERGGDRHERGGDRRWGNQREEKPEREPEWMDEPVNGKQEAHTQEDFQKWKEMEKLKEAMRKGDVGPPKTPAVEEPEGKLDGSSFFGFDKPKVETPLALAVDTGPDKFFGMWVAPKEEVTPDSAIESKKEAAAKGKTVGKASRFTSFFAPQEEPIRRLTEPSVPLSAPVDGLAALFQSNTPSMKPAEDKQAFAALLQKLTMGQPVASGTTPPVNPQQQSKPPPSEKQRSEPVPPQQESFQQYRTDERPSTSTRNSQNALQEMLMMRNANNSQASSRPEQMLQELVGQRQTAASQSSQRADPAQARNQADFLMGLMRTAPPARNDDPMLRMPPQAIAERHFQMQQQQQREQAQEQAQLKQAQQHQAQQEQARQQARQQQLALEQQLEMQHREGLLQREREARERDRAAAQRQVRGAPPGFFEEVAYHRGPPQQHERQPQPTQILQRPPPGLDQMPPGWAQSPGGLGPQQQIRQPQHIVPPPGLAGRGMPLPQQQMFPPGFMGSNFAAPDGRMPPPPGFYNPPPPGFMPAGMNGFQGPDGMSFGPYDGRGPPPQSGFRR